MKPAPPSLLGDTAATAPRRPAPARDAASAVCVRRRHTGLEVLLGRRDRGHRFLPGVYVFPGGRVDATDARVTSATPLRAEDETRLARHASARRARAIAVAAVRETWEEAGLLLGRMTGGQLRPDLARLRYIARAITPTFSPVRFHARFFLVEVSPEERLHEPRSDELHDLAWLALASLDELPLLNVSRAVLARAVGVLQGRHDDSIPLFHYRGRRARVSEN